MAGELQPTVHTPANSKQSQRGRELRRGWIDQQIETRRSAAHELGFSDAQSKVQSLDEDADAAARRFGGRIQCRMSEPPATDCRVSVGETIENSPAMTQDFESAQEVDEHAFRARVLSIYEERPTETDPSQLAVLDGLGRLGELVGLRPALDLAPHEDVQPSRSG